MNEQKFKVGDCVRVVSSDRKEHDAAKFLGQCLWILSISNTGGEYYISTYSLTPNGPSIALTGIWFSSLELVNSSPIEDFEYC